MMKCEDPSGARCTGQYEDMEALSACRFRPMDPQDLDQVAALEKKTFSEPWSRQGFADSLARPYARYAVAVIGEKLAGYCGYLRSFEEADIVNVAVAPELRGRGIGRKMLEYLMEEGRRDGVKQYTLEVRKSNAAARHLYETLGFELAGYRKNFYSKPTEDAAIMWTKEEKKE